MFNNSDEHSQADIPLIKYSYHTDTQSLATVCCCCVCVCVCVCVCTCSWILWSSVCCSSVRPESWWPGWFYPIPSRLPGFRLPADSGVPTSNAHLSAGTWQCDIHVIHTCAWQQLWTFKCSHVTGWPGNHTVFQLKSGSVTLASKCESKWPEYLARGMMYL